MGTVVGLVIPILEREGISNSQSNGATLCFHYFKRGLLDFRIATSCKHYSSDRLRRKLYLFIIEQDDPLSILPPEVRFLFSRIDCIANYRLFLLFVRVVLADFERKTREYLCGLLNDGC